MKKLLAYCLLTTLCSCYSLEQMSVDFLLPAKINFPQEVRKVGIVNNMDTSNMVILVKEDGLPKRTPDDIMYQTAYVVGDPALATQALAEAISEQDYFDQVSICDSALRAHDIQPRELTLGQDEVITLAGELDADMIIAVENVVGRMVRKVTNVADEILRGTIDTQIGTLLVFYVPSAPKPMARMIVRDSIYWDDYGIFAGRLSTTRLTNKEISDEVSVHLGTKAADDLVPHWNSFPRLFYNSNQAEFRDGMYLMQQGQWDEAAASWMKVWNQSKTKMKKQMYAAFNLAVYYELKNDIEQAKGWLAQARQICTTRHLEKSHPILGASISDVYLLSNDDVLTWYDKELDAHKINIDRLKPQMKRFESENK